MALGLPFMNWIKYTGKGGGCQGEGRACLFDKIVLPGADLFVLRIAKSSIIGFNVNGMECFVPCDH